ncbi:hypothetical protein COCCU_04615 [Corynebacterium occultum]|uniref:DUF4307 domain-containing protein n=1 Tax=Corynebacterium occultum TaxID=2675219 RepID=A0A6B8VUW1_9CORY|nr:DUF4307 domain-containing protein [Corynebacterium occultum]QGU06869.1 hypothetical protein COCCU_04615 [Corynebacterium occultum]
MSSPDIHRPTSRYGTDRTPAKPSGIGGKVIAVLLVAGLIAAVILIAQYINNRQSVEVTASMTSFERVDDNTMRLWVDIVREDPAEPAYCIVTAINYAMAEVGRREILLPAGGEDMERREVLIPTWDVPVSGSVYGCSTSVPSFLNL